MVHMEPPQSTYAERVAAEIRACLGRNRVTQGDLAKALGMSRKALRARLEGRRSFSVGELALAADYFDLSVAELLRRAEEAA